MVAPVTMESREGQRLLDKHRNINVDHDWWVWSIDDVRSVFEAFGFLLSEDGGVTTVRSSIAGRHTVPVGETGRRSAPIEFSLDRDRYCKFGFCSQSMAELLSTKRTTTTSDGKCAVQFDRPSCKVTSLIVKLLVDAEREFLQYTLNDDCMYLLQCYEYMMPYRDWGSSGDYVEGVIGEPPRYGNPDDPSPEMRAVLAKLEQKLEDFAVTISVFMRTVSTVILHELQEEYDHQTSDETIWDVLDADGILDKFDAERAGEGDE